MVLGDEKNSAMTPSRGIGTTGEDVTRGGASFPPFQRGERMTSTRPVKRAMTP
jgi:hypothetical protein